MSPLTHENEKLKEEVETAFQEIDELNTQVHEIAAQNKNRTKNENLDGKRKKKITLNINNKSINSSSLTQNKDTESTRINIKRNINTGNDLVTLSQITISITTK